MRRGGVYTRADVATSAIVCVISNDILHAAGPHVIVVPVFPVADDIHATQATISVPVRGHLTPNMVHWLPASALGEHLGDASAEAVEAAARTVIACIS